MAVSKRLRFEIFRRDNHACRYCGAGAPDAALTVDHVIPVALGGTDEPTNLVTACADCNAGKTSMPPDAEIVDDVRADAARWSAAMQTAAELSAAQTRSREAYVDEVIEAWQWYRKRVPRGLNASIGRFHDAGLPVSVCVEMVDVAFAAYGVQDRVSYFAGCCWARIREMQQVASELLAAPDTEDSA